MFDLCRGTIKTGISRDSYSTVQACAERAETGHRYSNTSSLVAIVAARARCGPRSLRNGYTVEMNSDAIERIETKIAFLESANVELSDVVYRQQQEILALRARLDALAQRLDAAQTTDTVRTPEEERPPHY
jgi:SlyX protein